MKNTSSLTPYRRAWRNPLALLDEVTGDLKRGFEDWPRLSLLPRDLKNAGFNPTMDAFEKDGELVVKVDLPGLDKSDVKVAMRNGNLELRGERKEEKEIKEDDFYRCERSYGQFFRSLPMPENVTEKDIKAKFKNGVLEVHVPLPPEAREEPAREITIS
jgi:HSP20 family protein